MTDQQQRFKPCIATMSLGPETASLLTKIREAHRVGFQGIELYWDDLVAETMAWAESGGFPRESVTLASFERTAWTVRRYCDETGTKVVSLQPFRNFDGHPTQYLSPFSSLFRRKSISQGENVDINGNDGKKNQENFSTAAAAASTPSDENNNNNDDDDDDDPDLEFKAWLGLATILGAKVIGVPASIIGRAHFNGRDFAYKTDDASIVADVRHLVDLAAEKGITIGYESLCFSNAVDTWERAWSIIAQAAADGPTNEGQNGTIAKSSSGSSGGAIADEEKTRSEVGDRLAVVATAEVDKMKRSQNIGIVLDTFNMAGQLLPFGCRLRAAKAARLQQGKNSPEVLLDYGSTTMVPPREALDRLASLDPSRPPGILLLQVADIDVSMPSAACTCISPSDLSKPALDDVDDDDGAKCGGSLAGESLNDSGYDEDHEEEEEEDGGGRVDATKNCLLNWSRNRRLFPFESSSKGIQRELLRAITGSFDAQGRRVEEQEQEPEGGIRPCIGYEGWISIEVFSEEVRAEVPAVNATRAWRSWMVMCEEMGWNQPVLCP